MLRPTKHAHPDQTVVSVATLLLQHLQDCRVEDYDRLRKFVSKSVAGGSFLLLPALNLLYLLGLIDFRPKTDAIEYTGER